VVPAKSTKKRRQDWYTISVETLRGWGVLLAVLALTGAGLLVYRQWERRALEREARKVIAEAAVLVQEVENHRDSSSFGEEFKEAWGSLEEARSRFGASEFSAALEQGRRSRTLLQSILDALRDRSLAGEAQFIAVQGGVEFRRGDRGQWEEARGRLVLRSGDYVKTAGNGSAEIVFLDGTLYTVRPNTLFLVTRGRPSGGQPGEQAISMQYGWVDLNTSQRGSRVTTPRAEAHVERNSEAVVTYDERSAIGRFAAFRGEVAVAAKGSTVEHRLAALQQVKQTGDVLSEPQPLPPRPALLEPADKLELPVERTKSVALAWQATPGAQRYALQVSRNRLFVDNVIDVDGRVKTTATLGVRGPGTFSWRVAAVSRDGLAGQWSEPRTFKLAVLRRAAADQDKAPPPLEVDEVQSYGSIFIVGGKTEPGAVVTVNGEQVNVAADGSFTKTVQLTNEGWSFVEIKSRDVAGNETVRRRRVFVETL